MYNSKNIKTIIQFILSSSDETISTYPQNHHSFWSKKRKALSKTLQLSLEKITTYSVPSPIQENITSTQMDVRSFPLLSQCFSGKQIEMVLKSSTPQMARK